MENTFTQRHPYISAILIGLLCTFMTALGMAIPQIIGLDVNRQMVLTTVFLIISTGMGILIMKKSRFTLLDYGLSKPGFTAPPSRKDW